MTIIENYTKSKLLDVSTLERLLMAYSKVLETLRQTACTVLRNISVCVGASELMHPSQTPHGIEIYI